jgi:group I intron endonuclease
MIGIVYKATCKVNQKVYIGVTSKSLNERIAGHVKLSKRKNPKYLFNKAIKKYGIENFLFEKIDTFLSFDERDEKEIKYIKERNSFYLSGPGYNMTFGGDGSR